MSLNLIQNIRQIDPKRKYWFIRTDSGNNYQTFCNNGFIGINWDEISVSEILSNSSAELKEKIALRFGLDSQSSNGKRKISDIHNKLHHFNNLKKGDIIVIPSENSEYLSFGEISDDCTYEGVSGDFECDYIKRRSVDWVKTDLSINALDPTFFKIKKTRHTISDISSFDYYIDSILYPAYRKLDNSHFVINIATTEEINMLSLAEMLFGIHHIMQLINTAFNLGEDIEEGTIRIYLQSPGLLNIKQPGYALVLAACLLGSSGCHLNNQNPEVKTKLDSVKLNNPSIIDTVTRKFKSMKIEN